MKNRLLDYNGIAHGLWIENGWINVFLKFVMKFPKMDMGLVKRKMGSKCKNEFL